MARISITRDLTVPDAIRLERYARAPELGPQVLFFSGGTALRNTSRALTEYTHNSIHLITPFDSGGSSAKLRDAFPMLAVGDLRNRLMALADTRLKGHPAVYKLFAHRFSKQAEQEELREKLTQLVRGEDRLVASIPTPLQRLIRTTLGHFAENMPSDFDLRGASIGNLILAGGILNNDGDIDAVIFLFSKLVEVHGLVRPVVDADLHLAAELENGDIVVGQHKLTSRQTPLASPIASLRLAKSLDDATTAEVHIDSRTEELIAEAELVVFPIGSFFTSVVACLLPRGVGRAVSTAACPKVYVPNCGRDPEQQGMSTADTVARLIAQLRTDAGPDVPTHRLLNVVAVDSRRGDYPGGLDINAIEALGVSVVDVDLVTDESAPLLDPHRLVEVLLSLV